MLNLQATNKFFYKNAVSRVQYSIRISCPFYFKPRNSSQIILSLDGASDKLKRISDVRFREISYIVQVGREMFTIETGNRLFHLSNIGSKNMTHTEMAKPFSEHR